jgi:hypothetical protein
VLPGFNENEIINIISALLYYKHAAFLYRYDSKMEALQVELIRSAPPWRKMEMLAGLNASARALALTGLHQRFPQAGEAELQRALADLLLGPDLARKVCGNLKDVP